MKKINYVFLYAAVTCLLLTGCATTGSGNVSSPQQQADASCSVFSKKMVFSSAVGALGGAAVGAGIGALAGNAGMGAAIGAGSGLLLGGIIGKIDDDSDCKAAMVALKAMNTTPVNTPVSWSNTLTGNSGSFTPTSDAAPEKSSGKICRTYTLQAKNKSGEQSQAQTGLTCRDNNGDWKLTT
jgi:surface antigen